MATLQNSYTRQYFRVIHPLHDEPEKKCSTEGLGRIDGHDTYGSCLAQTSTGLSSKDVGMLVHHVQDLAGVFHSTR